MNTPVERKLVPITNFLSRNNLLVRFGIGIVEKPMTWEEFLEVLSESVEVYLPSHVLYLTEWLQKISELPQKSRQQIVIQCTLGQELLDQAENIRKISQQKIKIDILTDRAPTDLDLKILNELNSPENISFTFCPQQFYPLTDEILKWKEVTRFKKVIYFHPKQHMIDPLYSQDEIEYFLPSLVQIGFALQINFQSTSEVGKDGTFPDNQYLKLKIFIFFLERLMNSMLILLRHLVFFLFKILYPIKKIYWFLEYQYRTRIQKKR